jgi:threonine aldolase
VRVPSYFALFKPWEKLHAPRAMSAVPDYTFASDNTAGLTPEALAALTAANTGCVPSYGDDEWTARAKHLIGELFATECEVFFVFNGTAANALALAQFCRSHHSVICHEVSHVDTDECAAPEFFTGGSKVIPVAGANGKLSPAALAPVFARGHGIHYPKPGALSLTQATEWGTLYTPDEVRALSAMAKQHGMAVFTWRAGVDVLCLGGTKGGMNSTEAVVFFNREHAREFEYRAKQAGQLASKMRFAAAQWCGMLEGGAWLRHAAHANAIAQKLATALRGLPGFRLLAEPEANGVFVNLPPATVAALTARGWHFYKFIGEHGHRLMCSWATPPEAVDRFIADLRAV